jgi:hypothetical protein
MVLRGKAIRAGSSGEQAGVEVKVEVEKIVREALFRPLRRLHSLRWRPYEDLFGN